MDQEIAVVRDFVSVIEPVLDSKIAAAVIGSVAALWTYRRQAKEKLAASVSWRWAMMQHGEEEIPFLVVQNMGSIPTYITSARYFRGNWFRRLVKQPHVMMFERLEDDSYPKKVEAASAGFFPMEQAHVERLAKEAGRTGRLFHRLGRPYVWVEIRTVAGRRILISAREGICPRDRPAWW